MAGRLQLETRGPQDKFFTIDPDYSYFTSRFSKHTNFARSFTKVEFDGAAEFGTIMRCRIPANQGDLVKTISVQIELKGIPNATNSGIGYAESIAHAMIEYVDLIIGGATIERLTSDMLQIYSETQYTQTNQTALSQLIGKYPNRKSSTRISDAEIISHLGPATTSERYFVDLPFYFYRNSGLAIPLCAIDKQEVEIEIKLRRIEECITNNSKVTINGLASFLPNTGKGSGYEIGSFLQSGADIDGEAVGDESGFAVSISRDGTTVAIGSPGNDGDPAINDRGSVRVYRMVGQRWIQIGQDIDGEVALDFFGQAVSLSADGNVLAIGAPDHNYQAYSNTGIVKIYNWTGSTWNLRDIIPPGDTALQNLNFGGALSLSDDGNRIVIGGRGYSTSKGAIYIYAYVEGTWNLEHREVGQLNGDALGYSVSISGNGNRVVTGANNPDGISYVRVMNYIESAWSQLGIDLESEGPGDEFGFSVDISQTGHRIVVGAPNNDGVGTNAGHARVFEYVESAWSQIGGDIDGEFITDQSGISVSMSSDGTFIAIGASQNSGKGHVRVYGYGNGSWLKTGNDLDAEALGDELGWSVSLSGDGTRVAAGAKSNDGNGTSSGHVRVYDLLIRDNLRNLIKEFSLNAEMIFLSTTERLKIQHTKMDYVITQYQQNEFKIQKGQNNGTFKLQFTNPVKELFFVFQRENKKRFDDFVSVFDYDNIYSVVNDRLFFYENLDTLELTLDDEKIIANDTGKFMYLKAVQTGIHHTKTPLIRRFYTYSFALEPEKPYPTGQRNFSLVKNQTLKVTVSPNNTHDRNLRVYALSHNILRIMDGIVRTIFDDNY
jgi:hypothetical protein